MLGARMVNPHADKAKGLLRHYFERAGVIASPDTRVEIDEIIDHIVDAAVLEARAEIAARVAQGAWP